MGGRGSSSSLSVSQNAQKHKRFIAGELGTKYTKSDKFNNEVVFKNQNYWRDSSGYQADRVSSDGKNITVMVSTDQIYKTKYGYALILDRNHVAYVKDWQVTNQRVAYKGSVGTNVSLSEQYFKATQTKTQNRGYGEDKANLSFGAWKDAARKQQAAGNYVRVDTSSR